MAIWDPLFYGKGLERGWNDTKDIQVDQFSPFSRSRMSQMWPNNFTPFWPLFGPRKATFGTFWVQQMAQTGLSGCLHWSFNLRPPLPTQNRSSWPNCVTKRLFLAYFDPFWVPIRPHLGHSGSCDWPKLVCLDVVIGVPTFFRPFQPKKALKLIWLAKRLF